MIAYKLFRQRRDGSFGPLFIQQKLKIFPNQWLDAELYPTKGFSPRKGWHCTLKPEAPHLKQDGRVWCKVEIEDYTFFERPITQGGMWALANRMRVIEILDNN